MAVSCLFSKYFLFAHTLVLLSETASSKTISRIFDISYFEGSPDGVHKEKILGVNEQFPGPAIYADVGDTIEIDIVNNIQDGQNVSIHWHGLHQRGQYCEDGTSQISQCPLKNGYTQHYRFTVKDAGTHW
jgi:FtsP/CotA-like multicopper oxidase with cupredoxin domain